jgi:hypothetical protein
MTTNNDRLVITWQKDTSATEAFSFTSLAAVRAQYGLGSPETKIARGFFTNFPHNTITFIRYGMGQRPHLIGGNINNLQLADLQNITGTLDVTLSIPNGPIFNYAGTVDLSSATSFASAAVLIANALNAHLPIAATTTGDTLTAKSLTFQGYVTPGQTSHLFITALDANNDPIVPGGLVSGLNIAPGAQIISQLNSTEPNGELGGTGEYDLFSFKGGGTTAGTFLGTNPLTNSGTISETYGLLSVGDVIAGQLTVGERIQPTKTNGIPPLTAIADQAPDGINWIINNAVNASGSFNMTAPGLDSQAQTIIGTRTGTITNEYFDLQPDGHYGYNFNPSIISAVTGTAAHDLGLSADAGAILSSPGGAHFSIAGYMDRIIHTYTDQNGAPISFGTFQSEEPRLDPLFQAWTTTQAGRGYTFLT